MDSVIVEWFPRVCQRTKAMPKIINKSNYKIIIALSEDSLLLFTFTNKNK